MAFWVGCATFLHLAWKVADDRKGTGPPAHVPSPGSLSLLQDGSSSYFGIALTFLWAKQW